MLACFIIGLLLGCFVSIAVLSLCGISRDDLDGEHHVDYHKNSAKYQTFKGNGYNDD